MERMEPEVKRIKMSNETHKGITVELHFPKLNFNDAFYCKVTVFFVVFIDHFMHVTVFTIPVLYSIKFYIYQTSCTPCIYGLRLEGEYQIFLLFI